MPSGAPEAMAHMRRAGLIAQQDREKYQELAAAESQAVRQGGGVAGWRSRDKAAERYKDVLINRPRAENFEPPPPPPPEPTPVLTSGSATSVVKKLGGSSNACYVVQMEDGSKAFFKPEAGETWEAGFCNNDISTYITNKDFSLAEREATAHEVSIALGFGELVPETHLREHFDVPGIDLATDDESGGGYDEDYVRSLYNQYHEKAQEKAFDEAGEEMANQYYDAQQEHLRDVKNRAEEMTDIWNEVIKEFPDGPDYGSQSALQEHPRLPLGSQHFSRPPQVGVVDPLDVLKEADVDISAAMNNEERERVADVFRDRLKAGHQELGDVDEEAAKDDLDRDQWYEDHQNTEARLIESKIQSFDSWRHSQGYDSGDQGGGGNVFKNSEAPHPHGGSLQRWLNSGGRDGDMTHEEATQFAVLDYVLGTMDRHGNNIMFSGGKAYAIDNGYAFPGPDTPDGFTYRSDAVREWMGDDQHREVPESTRNEILGAMNRTDWKALVDRHPSMSREERQSFLDRVDKMKEALSYAEGLSTLWHDQQLMY